VAAGCGGDDSAAPSATGAQPTEDSAELDRIKFIDLYWIGSAPWFVAIDQGFDRQNGLEIEHKTITTLKEITDALGSGNQDVTSGVVPGQALIFLSTGIDTRQILVGNISTGADAIIGANGIETVEDLRGRSVGVEFGAGGDFLLRYALQENGMTIDDIKAVDLPPPDAVAALNAGRLDAAYAYEPYISTALKEEGRNIVYTAGDAPGLLGDFVIARSEFAEEQPETLVKLMKTYQDAVEFMRQSPDEFNDIVSQTMDLPLDEVEAQLNPDKLQFFDLEESIDFFNDDWPALAPVYIDMLNDLGQLPEELTVDQALAAVDTSFAEDALPQGNR
jgi:NitT/TauT family transport system substrate-binding protein